MKNTYYPNFNKWVKISAIIFEILSNEYKHKKEDIPHNF
jgi:hypothetical protein